MNKNQSHEAETNYLKTRYEELGRPGLRSRDLRKVGARIKGDESDQL